jgi:hypothetical protein
MLDELTTNVKQVRYTYNMLSLIPSANEIITTLENRLSKALIQRASICATILDPRFNIEFFQTHFDSLMGYNTSRKKLETCFIEEAKYFISSQTRLTPPEASPTCSFEAELFGGSNGNEDSVEDEIKRYFCEPLEKGDTNILLFWKIRHHRYPLLSIMAKTYLAIPATCTPSEEVFTAGGSVIRYQYPSLNPEKIEKLICVKEWYRVFGPLYNEAL